MVRFSLSCNGMSAGVCPADREAIIEVNARGVGLTLPNLRGLAFDSEPTPGAHRPERVAHAPNPRFLLIP